MTYSSTKAEERFQKIPLRLRLMHSWEIMPTKKNPVRLPKADERDFQFS
jgi:hypothetical protein